MSVDPAHSLADAFDLEGNLFGRNTADPYTISPGLDIHEVNIQYEIRRHWREISGYVSAVLRTTGKEKRLQPSTAGSSADSGK